MSGSNNKVEEEFIIARLYINEMQSEVKDLMQRCQALETFQANCNKKICEYKSKFSNCQLLISQYETRIRTLTESLEEAHKRGLEKRVHFSCEECANLKAAKQTQAGKNKEKDEKKEAVIHTTLEKQMEQLRSFYQNQIVTLIKKMSYKNEVINELETQNQKLILAHNQIQADYNQLKQEETEKSVKLQEIISVNERCEQAWEDLKELEETVGQELYSLYNLLIQDLQNCLQLTKVHKQLDRDNSDLRYEQSELEEKLRATIERMEALQIAMRDTTEVIIQDRKCYEQEVNRLNEVIKKLKLAQCEPSVQIV